MAAKRNEAIARLAEVLEQKHMPLINNLVEIVSDQDDQMKGFRQELSALQQRVTALQGQEPLSPTNPQPETTHMRFPRPKPVVPRDVDVDDARGILHHIVCGGGDYGDFDDEREKALNRELSSSDEVKELKLDYIKLMEPATIRSLRNVKGQPAVHSLLSFLDRLEVKLCGCAPKLECQTACWFTEPLAVKISPEVEKYISDKLKEPFFQLAAMDVDAWKMWPAADVDNAIKVLAIANFMMAEHVKAASAKPPVKSDTNGAGRGGKGADARTSDVKTPEEILKELANT